ncbi:MAG: flagellin [Planctomycetia bacterium]|nr:flagellin [Planctomycetia bacterium]
MTRINTNVPSLVAQTRLQRTNADLNTSLTRLSTGLRINTGKDDPAGLIASETLRTDMISVQTAISNAERANQVIATADSALGQISTLLNDIRGLVSEAANTGALSPEQLAANQLQVDSSLEAINRIAQITSFQGRNLLDGSLDFITGATPATVSELNVTQANLGSTGTLAVSVDITAAATQATLTGTVAAPVAGTKASATIQFVQTPGNYDQLVVTAAATGTKYNGVKITFIEDASIAVGSAIANYNGTDTINVYVANSGTTLFTTINTAINNLADFDSVTSSVGTGDGKYDTAVDNPGTVGTTAGGVDATSGLLDDLTFEVRGATGSEVFTFETAATGTQMANAINLVSDSTGVTAAFAGTTLTFTSSAYGTDAFVEVKIISEGAAGTFGASLSGARDEGTDIAATVNGVTAVGRGNTLSVNTSVLDLSATVNDGSSTDFSFTITGGGALFQIGPEVVSNQQARLGIQAVNTARLGGTAGRLFTIATGAASSLENDPTNAARIVEQAIDDVTQLRGRLGAFQGTTLEATAFALSDTLSNLTEAESSIRDADFAVETSRLTRAQILVQSGTTVLAIANASPQNALALLG